MSVSHRPECSWSCLQVVLAFFAEGVQGKKDVCVPRSDSFPEGARGWDPGSLAVHLEVGLEFGCQGSLISRAAASQGLHGVLIFLCVYMCVCVYACVSGLTCYRFDLWASDSRHIWFNYPHPPVDLEAQVCKALPPCLSFMAACVCACAYRCVFGRVWATWLFVSVCTGCIRIWLSFILTNSYLLL